MLCWLLPYNNMNQSEMHTYPLLEPPSKRPSILPLWVVTELWDKLLRYIATSY